MEITAAYFKAIGLNPTIKMMDRASMLRMVSEAKDPGMVIAWRTSYRPSVSGQFYDKFYPNGESNLHFTSEELVALVDKYEAELDIPARAAALAKVCNYLHDNWTLIPMVTASSAWASRDAVVGEWPKSASPMAHMFEYVRHAKPLNTWRLFTPGQ